LQIEVIAGIEEARLLYIGAMHSLAYSQDTRLVIDIGGGSTEFVTGQGYDPQIMESVTMGCVSFSNRYFEGGMLTENNFDNAILASRGKIQTMEYLFAKHDWSEAIGTSGTARALYDLCTLNGFSDQITLDGLYKIKKTLIKSKNTRNLSMTGLKEDRIPVLPGGLSIMIAVFEELQISKMTIADGALREGVMYDLFGRKTDQDLRLSTVASLKKRYAIDEDQSKRVSTIAIQIYNQLADSDKTNDEQVKLLQWASELYEIGLSISHSDYHKHGAYMLANADFAGFSKPEQTVLSDLVRSHRGNLSKAIDSLNNKKRAMSKLLLMILALRLSVIFNRNRKDINGAKIIEVVEADKGNGFDLIVDGNWLRQNPLTLYSLNEEISEWKKLDIKIKLVTKPVIPA